MIDDVRSATLEKNGISVVAAVTFMLITTCTSARHRHSKPRKWPCHIV